MASVTSSGACRARYSLRASLNNWLRDFFVCRAGRSAASNTLSRMEIAVYIHFTLRERHRQSAARSRAERRRSACRLVRMYAWISPARRRRYAALVDRQPKHFLLRFGDKTRPLRSGGPRIRTGKQSRSLHRMRDRRKQGLGYVGGRKRTQGPARK